MGKSQLFLSFFFYVLLYTCDSNSERSDVFLVIEVEKLWYLNKYLCNSVKVRFFHVNGT